MGRLVYVREVGTTFLSYRALNDIEYRIVRPNPDLQHLQEELAADTKVVVVQDEADLAAAASLVVWEEVWVVVWAWEVVDQVVQVVAKSTCQTFVLPSPGVVLTLEWASVDSIYSFLTQLDGRT